METDSSERQAHANNGALDQAVEYFYSNNNDGGLFLISAREYLERGECTQLFEIIHAEEHRDLTLFVGWELVKIIFQFLPDVGQAKYNVFTEALDFICNVCNPREICLSLCEIFRHDLPFNECLLLIRLFQTACTRLEGKVAKIYSNFLTSLTGYLKENNAQHFWGILKTTLALLKSRDADSQSGDASELRCELVYFFVKLLELVETDFCEKEPKIDPHLGDNLKTDTPCYKSENLPENLMTTEVIPIIVEYIACLEGKCLKSLLSYAHTKESALKSIGYNDYDDETWELSYIGLGSLSYLIFAEDTFLHFLPSVLTGKYHFEMTLPYINTMLCHQHLGVVKKGVVLFLTVIKQIDDGVLDHCFGDEDKLFKSATFLVRVTTHCEDSGTRQRAVKALREFFTKFTTRARYKILRLLYQRSYHAGVAEFLILTFKAEIVRCLENNNDWFGGEKLMSFLQIIFVLPASMFESEYGLVEEKNRILSTLNLYRFLVIKNNETPIKMDSFVNEVENKYLKPLQDAISLGKAKINTYIKENLSKTVVVPKNDVFEVSMPDGRMIDQGSPQEQLQSMQNALLTVDMMESVVVRIREISRETRNNERTK